MFNIKLTESTQYTLVREYYIFSTSSILHDDSTIVHLMIHGSMNEQNVTIFRSYLTREPTPFDSEDLY